ncbi:MAG: LysM peptidoglycan-binding domain-containing protein [Candidatus Omnitrophica bacterium]|nr:LysM peptidoglycan-binding domain-containing protein [Candidatus Omnitrophota bacterium]
MIKKNSILLACVLVGVTSLTGCVTVETVTVDRVDQEVSGNQGYLSGAPAAGEKKPRKKTKSFIKVDVDLSRLQGYESPEEDSRRANESRKKRESERGAVDSPGTYNKGYFIAEGKKGEAVEIPELSCEIIEEFEGIEEIEEIEEIKEPVFDIYTVKKGETLWDIAGRPEIYGNSTRWRIIYDANKDKIKKPKLIKPGMKLKIPR